MSEYKKFLGRRTRSLEKETILCFLNFALYFSWCKLEAVFNSNGIPSFLLADDYLI